MSELIIEGQAPEQPIAAPDAPQEPQETVVETPEPDAQVAAPDAPVEPDAPPAPKHKGAVAELMEHRRNYQAEREARLQLEGELRAIKQQIESGQLLQRPQANPTEVEQQRLTMTAQKLGLFKADGTPDLEAAGRADAWVRESVRQEVDPIRHMTMAEKAHKHVNYALLHAAQQGLSPEAQEIIAATYGEVLQQPNGAQILAQPEVAVQVWHQGVGRAVAAGKWTARAPAPAAPQGTPPSPAPAAGRRAPTSAAIQLSPSLAKVYQDHGIDPNKSYSTKVQITNPAAIPLE